MQIKVAKTAGFCFGVKRAVETVYEQAEKQIGEKKFILMVRLFIMRLL